MHLVIFGLTVTSSWGNGHATLWRGLLKALARRGHTATFFEKNTRYYEAARDGWEAPAGVTVRVYADFGDIRAEVRSELGHADVAMLTSYCEDGPVAAESLLESKASRVFYDLDTPVTLTALAGGRMPAYLPARGLRDFGLVLSYTGGRALTELQERLDARTVAPLYGWVDPDVHRPVPPVAAFRNDLSYMGTYAADRQAGVDELFVEPAEALPAQSFLIAGSQYPEGFPSSDNIRFAQHLEPAQHPAFFCSSRATLNVTRQVMASYGLCPSGRLFEAAACGAPVISDQWQGLSEFFVSGTEILLARDRNDVVAALSLTDNELQCIGAAARARALRDHTAASRVLELERLLEQTRSGSASLAQTA